MAHYYCHDARVHAAAGQRDLPPMPPCVAHAGVGWGEGVGCEWVRGLGGVGSL